MDRSIVIAALVPLMMLMAACSPVSFGSSDAESPGEPAATSETIAPSVTGDPDSPARPNAPTSLSGTLNGEADVEFKSDAPKGYNSFRIILKMIDKDNQPLPFLYQENPYSDPNLESVAVQYANNALIVDVKAKGDLKAGPTFLLKILHPDKMQLWVIDYLAPDGTKLQDEGSILSYR